LKLDAPIHQIEDFPVASSECVDESRVEELKNQFGLKNGNRVVVYTGNFQSYQGLDLLVDALKVLFADEYAKQNIRVLLVGGEGLHDPLISQYQQRIEQDGVADYVQCTGPLPMADMGNVMALADVLVSPRSEGGNTPLKIYSYMASGRAIVATNLETHTQVLDDTTAILAEPTPKSYGEALLSALGPDDASRDRLASVGQAAKDLVAERYSRESFVRRVGEFYEAVLGHAKTAIK
jgi:glycosyltransferase involved in cell wall biosynthesis